MKDTNKKSGIFKRMRTRIIALLGALGVATAGGHALLNNGSDNVQDTKTKIESTNTGKTTRDPFKEGINFDTTIVDKILVEYNANLPEEEKITEDDLGIILQEEVGNGHVIKDVAEDGEVSYIENYYKTAKDLEEGQEFMEDNAISNMEIYTLVDNSKENTLAGVIEIGDEYHEIEVQSIEKNGKEYLKDDETYVGIPENVKTKDVYKNFENYYNKRLNKLENQKYAENVKEKTDDELEY